MEDQPSVERGEQERTLQEHVLVSPTMWTRAGCMVGRRQRCVSIRRDEQVTEGTLQEESALR